MRLKYYLTEYKKEGRGKEISFEQAVKMAPRFSEAIKSNTILTRHAHTAKNILHYLVDPKKFKEKRISRNTSNYYTLIMDTSFKWAAYPKRSKSLICSINRTQGERYPHRVFPENGSQMGVCPSYDMWDAFRKNGLPVLSEVNSVLNILLNIGMSAKQKNKRGLPDKKYDKNIAMFKQACKSFDKWFESKEYDKRVLYDIIKKEYGGDYYANQMMKLMAWYGDSGGLFKMMDHLLDPENNGFDLTYPTGMQRISGEKEVWTDGLSLMVRGDAVENFLTAVKAKENLKRLETT